jgi:molecular chaperone DnaK (HSP70)
VEETIAAAEELLGSDNQEFEALYITGGGSELPLVARALRERFGRRVRRSAYTRSATAIGLAIQADQPDRYRLSDRLSRYFGVWREADAGCRIVFDPLFEKGAPLPPAGEPPLSIRRSYSPVHNIGHFRFLECSHRMSDGAPSGEVTVWDEIRFPFEPELQEGEDLVAYPVTHSDRACAQRIQEQYECDAGGAITVRIMNESSGHERTYRLGRWSTTGATGKATKAIGRKKSTVSARGAVL